MKITNKFRLWLIANLLVLLNCGGSGGGGSAIPSPPPLPPPPSPPSLDIATLTNTTGFLRVYGGASIGGFGVPVAGGFDCDGDGFIDVVMSGMRASPFGRVDAGQVSLVFGDGQLSGEIDTASAQNNVLVIAGATTTENAGIEVWMDDVNGDSLGDILIGRSNFSPAGRIGAGALSIVLGNSLLHTMAGNGDVLDLNAPPPGIEVISLLGAQALDRLGFWFRTGDIDNDGVSDVLISADQTDNNGEANAGTVYVLRGGTHLSGNQEIDLASFGRTPFVGQLGKILPPAGSDNFHFGATLTIADLDGNGTGELLLAASLSRIGGLLEAAGAPAGSGVRNGGNVGGSLFIVWDDNIPTTNPWPAAFTLNIDSLPGTLTRINGADQAGVFSNERFGEELLGGEDYDGDGQRDLFVGDIHGDAGVLADAGLGHIFFNAQSLKNLEFDVNALPPGVQMTTLLGQSAGAISGDTSLHGDIDADGITDLVVASPLADPLGRINAGMLHVLWGQPGSWPTTIDLANPPAPSSFALTEIIGAAGSTSNTDAGDTLMYSAVSADIDGDGQSDLIVNEMLGNGLNSAEDVGNLIVISGRLVPR